MSHVYCPECGFQSPEAANFCARCGALIARDMHDENTQSIDPSELIEHRPARTAARGSSCAPAGAGRASGSRRAASAR